MLIKAQLKCHLHSIASWTASLQTCPGWIFTSLPDVAFCSSGHFITCHHVRTDFHVHLPFLLLIWWVLEIGGAISWVPNTGPSLLQVLTKHSLDVGVEALHQGAYPRLLNLHLSSLTEAQWRWPWTWHFYLCFWVSLYFTLALLSLFQIQEVFHFFQFFFSISQL